MRNRGLATGSSSVFKRSKPSMGLCCNNIIYPLETVEKKRLCNKYVIFRTFSAGTHPTTKLYALGENWTGALGDGRLDQTSPDDGQGFVEMELPSEQAEGDIEAIAAGWGHTAVVMNDCSGLRRLFLCGRPHEFRTLLRLKRLPNIVRRMAVHISWQHTYDTSQMDQSTNPYGTLADRFEKKREDNDDERRKAEEAKGASEEGVTNGNSPGWLAVLNALGRQQQRMENLGGALHPAAQQSILLKLTEIPLVDEASDKFRQKFSIDHPYDNRDTVKKGTIVAASAGLTAVVSPSGRLYTLGVNNYGQCGVGFDSNNVWTPTPVVGLTSREAEEEEEPAAVDAPLNRPRGRSLLSQQEFPIVSVSLGLQHGMALDSQGQVYTWGKGERGQLGHADYIGESVPYAIPITIQLPNSNQADVLFTKEVANEMDKAETSPGTATASSSMSSDIDRVQRARARNQAKLRLAEQENDLANFEDSHLLSGQKLTIAHIAAGFNHCACVTTCNRVFLWGKNMKGRNPSKTEPAEGQDTDGGSSKFADCNKPRAVPGLPPKSIILDVKCGSHHTSVLLDDGSVWAIGVATDNGEPMLDGFVEIVPSPPHLDHYSSTTLSCGYDRTIVVRKGTDGECKEVREVQLWSDEELREDDDAVVEPQWMGQFSESRGSEDYEDGESQEISLGPMVDSDIITTPTNSRTVSMVSKGWLHTVVVVKDTNSTSSL
jgi:alpha-tubulin suppressor-like RCC1 family protein